MKGYYIIVSGRRDTSLTIDGPYNKKNAKRRVLELRTGNARTRVCPARIGIIKGRPIEWAMDQGTGDVTLG